jgi:hypothetical protein
VLFGPLFFVVTDYDLDHRSLAVRRLLVMVLPGRTVVVSPADPEAFIHAVEGLAKPERFAPP